jgi:hypothetical protein
MTTILLDVIINKNTINNYNYYIYMMHEICKEGDFVIFFWYRDVKYIIFLLYFFMNILLLL